MERSPVHSLNRHHSYISVRPRQKGTGYFHLFHFFHDEQVNRLAAGHTFGIIRGSPLTGRPNGNRAFFFRVGEVTAHRQDGGVNFRSKIIAWDKLPEWREKIRATGRKLVVTNGCFDILHLGHVTYLETARNFGDALLVGINSDEATRQLKGTGRPVNSENDRASVLAALQSTDGICIFTDKTATKFLASAQPDIYAKGGDYTLDTLNQDERRAVEQGGGKIVIVPFVSGRSTTALLEKISRL